MYLNHQNLLLALARESIKEALTGELSVTLKKLKENPPSELTGEEGAFVTLKREASSPATSEVLRGCIGNVLGQKPLYRLVYRLAQESAFHDPRFPPLRLEELPQIKIEISILSIPYEVKAPQEIEVGRDGVILTHGRHRALFLPQVAPEQGWDRETMLNHLAMKAGLYPTAWQQKECVFEVFQAEIFEEQ
jgi:AmmeMemoRadiSam system protein A